MRYPRVYFDADDVERGYYVYAHRCHATNRVFYIGKGKHDRAWSDRRSGSWHEFVEKLPDGYDTIILHSDLTEDEAIDLEREEIEAYGGPASTGGDLINWIPGEAGLGFGAAVKITLTADEHENDAAKRAADALYDRQQDAYKAIRQYKPLTVLRRKQLRDNFRLSVWPTLEPVHELHYEYCEQRLPWCLLSTFVSQTDEIDRLNTQSANRKMKFAQFCEEVDQCIESMHFDLTKAIENHENPKYIAACNVAYIAVTEWAKDFATGNLCDALLAADGVFLRERLQDQSIDPNWFEAYVHGWQHLRGQEYAIRLRELHRQITHTK